MVWGTGNHSLINWLKSAAWTVWANPAELPEAELIDHVLKSGPDNVPHTPKPASALTEAWLISRSEAAPRQVGHESEL